MGREPETRGVVRMCGLEVFGQDLAFNEPSQLTGIHACLLACLSLAHLVGFLSLGLA